MKPRCLVCLALMVHWGHIGCMLRYTVQTAQIGLRQERQVPWAGVPVCR